MSDAKQIWVLVEYLDGQVKPVSLEALNAARQLAEPVGGTVTAVMCCAPGTSVPSAVESAGVERIQLLNHPALELFNSLAWVSALAGLLSEQKPDVLMLGATNHGKELAPAPAMNHYSKGALVLFLYGKKFFFTHLPVLCLVLL